MSNTGAVGRQELGGLSDTQGQYGLDRHLPLKKLGAATVAMLGFAGIVVGGDRYLDRLGQAAADAVSVDIAAQPDVEVLPRCDAVTRAQYEYAAPGTVFVCDAVQAYVAAATRRPPGADLLTPPRP